LLNESPERLFKAMSLVMDITGAIEGFIAIKRKHKTIIKNLKDRLKNYSDKRVKLFELDDFYPAGDEFILVYEVTGQVIPERGLPLEVGSLVQNVTTLVQVLDAVEDKPVINRYVTISGEVREPKNVLLPLGTSFEEAISLAGGATIDSYKVIHGGPMMGKLVEDVAAETVTKTTSLILVLPEEHVVVNTKQQPINITLRRAKSACCQCSKCTDLCPRGLIGHPLKTHKILRTISYNLADPAEYVLSSYLCSECGLCSMYSCQMGLTPHRVNIEIKASLTKNNFKYNRLTDHYEVDKEEREIRKVPTNRLINRLDLTKYAHYDLPTIKNSFKPGMVRISLQQHIGSPAIPIVKKGSKVKAGDLIADIPSQKLGAKIHASISGTVVDINDKEIVIKG
jgi:Na+-translocating ferredoxin:NAD+ oxidoreductase RnfC subunit